ncbi:MAG: S-methyl-5-thioribose-1-phosphate isomerase [Pseudomonadota bacterium]
MNVGGQHRRTIWVEREPGPDTHGLVGIIDQTFLPHRFATVSLDSLEDAAYAIKAMVVRGAPLIGATAAYGMALAVADNPSDAHLRTAYDVLYATRPTAVNLRWALDEMLATLLPLSPEDRCAAAWALAGRIADDDVEICRMIGVHGLPIIRELANAKDGPVNILTHCNAGWLATVDWGTATSPIYQAHDEGIAVHVWADETRPRNQGAALTAWELNNHGVPHKVIVDNAGGHLMQHGMVDMVIVGTDRTTAQGDVCNKIGTYLKALAAHDNGVPFYVALPSPTIDFTLSSGFDIPIEERGGEEVSKIWGRNDQGELGAVQITPDGSPVANYAFDVTPARLVTGLITERGVAAANGEAIAALFPERARAAA